MIRSVSANIRPDGDTPVGEMTLGDLLAPHEVAAEGDWLALIHAMARGEPQALRALHDRSHRLVFTLLLRIFGDQRIAEELTVRVYRRVWESVGAYTPQLGSVIGWLMILTRTVALEQLQHQPPISDDGRSRRLSVALGRLDPAERALIELVYFLPCSITEAAARMKLPIEEVAMRVHSALENLCEAYAAPESR